MKGAGLRVAAALLAAAVLSWPAAAQAMSWSAGVSVDANHHRLNGVACPTSTQCTAVDADGFAATFDPASAGPVAKTTTRIDPGPLNPDVQCTPQSVCELNAVACPSAHQCAAVDVNGIEVTFDPTAPGGAKLANIDPADNGGYSLNGVACPSTQQCTAVDSIAAQVTFNALHPHHVHEVQIDTRNSVVQLDAVACPSLSECVGVDSQGYEVRFKPSASKAFLAGVKIDPGRRLNAVACSSVGRCTAVDREGREFTFDPRLAHPTVQSSKIDTVDLNGIACPSRRLCVVADKKGRVVAGDPGGHWKVVALRRAARLEAITCVSASKCVAVDSAGAAFVGR
jgi:hypothetical protein